MSSRRWGPIVPSVVGVTLLIGAGAAGFIGIAGEDLSFLPCDGTFSLFAENVRCRWPAVYIYLGLICLVAAVIAFVVAVKLAARNEKAANPAVNKDAPKAARPLL